MNERALHTALFLSLVLCFGFMTVKNKKILFEYPEYWPAPQYDFSKLSMKQEEFDLGRALFYDPILSKDNSISCASCHTQATGFTHVDHDLSHGIKGRIGKRNALSLLNLAWNTSFMWDGGVNHIELQALAPITDANEMDETLANVVEKLKSSEHYNNLFSKVHSDGEITGQRVLLALTQFVVMFNSYNSKYDKYIRNESENTFTRQEKNGLQIFRQHCATCHTEPLFTNNQFENNGLKVDTTLNDYGRYFITSNPKDSLKFKVPSLRNIQFTKPYMHDGRFESLQSVINHYTSEVQPSKTLSKKLEKKIILTHIEKIDLLVFLRTLSDDEFLFDKRFSFPFQQLIN
jgi:cytochrome c peroxidase